MKGQTSTDLTGTRNGQLRFVESIFFALGLVALFVSWWLLAVYLAAWTEGVLAPWDIDKRALPNEGTFPREVNDFFEGRGWWVPSVLSVCLSAICALSRLSHTRFRQVSVPWELAGTNLVFGLALFFMGYPVGELDNLLRQRFSLPDTPHFYPLYITLSLLLWFVYLLVQKRGILPMQYQTTSDK